MSCVCWIFVFVDLRGFLWNGVYMCVFVCGGGMLLWLSQYSRGCQPSLCQLSWSSEGNMHMGMTMDVIIVSILWFLLSPLYFGSVFVF